MKVERVIRQMSEIYEIAANHYPPGDTRPGLFLELQHELITSIDDRQQRVMLEQIKGFISGGMGGFTDTALILPPDVHYARFSKAYFKQISELYNEIVRVLAGEKLPLFERVFDFIHQTAARLLRKV